MSITKTIDQSETDLAPYLDGKSYDETRLIGEVEFYARAHAYSGYEVGRRLIALKANLPHGAFGKLVTERLQLSPGYASRLMNFADRIVKAAVANGTALDTDKLQRMDAQKVILLGEVLETHTAEIQESGTIAGLTLDEYDAMPRAELKKLVRHLKAKDERREKLLDDQEKATAEANARIVALTSATPTAVSEACHRFLTSLKDTFADFEKTAISKSELPHHVLADIVEVRNQVRAFNQMIHDITDERFPSALNYELPPEDAPFVDPVVTASKAKKAKQATVVDAVAKSK